MGACRHDFPVDSSRTRVGRAAFANAGDVARETSGCSAARRLPLQTGSFGLAATRRLPQLPPPLVRIIWNRACSRCGWRQNAAKAAKSANRQTVPLRTFEAGLRRMRIAPTSSSVGTRCPRILEGPPTDLSFISLLLVQLDLAITFRSHRLYEVLVVPGSGGRMVSGAKSATCILRGRRLRRSRKETAYACLWTYLNVLHTF